MEKPNILLIITDQQRVDTLSYRGLTQCKTPNIDRLAENGVSFDKCITPCPLCTPARASIFTGMYPHQLKAREPENSARDTMLTNGNIINREPQFANLLRENGYHLNYAGKWHVGDEVITDWFDNCNGYTANAEEYSNWCKENGLPDGWAFNDYNVRSERPPNMSIPKPMEMNMEPSNHVDAWISDHLIEQLKNRPKDKPFFSVCGFHGPHPPFKIPEPYYSMYDPESIPEPPNFNMEYGKKPDYILNCYYHKLVEDFGVDWSAWKKSVAVYWGFVSMIDDQIGRILSYLEEENTLKDTLVIFISDHGEFLGQHGLWHKMQAYEEALRVPMIFSAPWLGDNVRSKAGASLIDIVPTILSILDLDIPEEIEGCNLSPELKNEGSSSKDRFLFSEHKPLGNFHGAVDWRVVTNNRYKYIWNNGDVNEFYDLVADPYELKNIVDNDEQYDNVRKFEVKLKKWMEKTSDPLFTSYKSSIT